MNVAENTWLLPETPSQIATYVQLQRGVVLVLALIFLLLMSILAISASDRSLLQERMAGGMRSAQLAEWSAETALRGTEWQLFNGHPVPCYDSSQSGRPSDRARAFRRGTAWMTAGLKYSGASGAIDWTGLKNNAVLGSNPYYIVEYLGLDRSPDAGISGASELSAGSAVQGTMYLYRITARGEGGSARSVRLLESIFVTPFKLVCTLS